MADEVWKPISGYEGLYSVSNYGNIRAEGEARGQYWFDKVTELVRESGEKTVRLSRDGVAKKFSVDELVADAFVGPRPGGEAVVVHKNNSKKDNRAENLEWAIKPGPYIYEPVTSEIVNEIVEAMAKGEYSRAVLCYIYDVDFMAMRQRLFDMCVGKSLGSTLTADDAREMYRLFHKDGLSIAEVSDKFQITATTVRNIVLNKQFESE
jgi:hypothetical protein